jgi:hypothetical protein
MVKDSLENKTESIKTNIRDWHQYFNNNFKRFDYWRRFIFETTLSDEFISMMQELGRPQLEFNILEAYINRLLGEFSKQEPSFKVSQSDIPPFAPAQLIQIIEGYMRYILSESNRDNMQYQVYKDIVSGGFSCVKVYTDYANEMSLDQNIFIKRVYDPTLIIFDKYARDSHKGDGQYSGELYPLSREDFEEKWGKEKTSKMKFSRNIQPTGSGSFDFQWSFVNANTQREVVLLGDYYEKVYKKEKLVRVRDHGVMTEKKYEEFAFKWIENGNMGQIPAVIGKPVTKEIVHIDHYQICENEILDKEETDLKFLPHVFVDGNSEMIKNRNDGSSYQFTKPLVYHAESIQKLKNFAGISLANELENSMQHKLMAAKEGIPAEYKDAYINFQKPSTIIYNAYKDNDPNVPLPPPQTIPRQPTPPEIMQTFSVSDEMTKAILGSYDASLGIQNNSLSGVAIQNGATNSNASSQPWNVGYLRMMNRVAEIVLHLIPKIHSEREYLPAKMIDGKSNNVKINSDKNNSMDFDPLSMIVKVEAGVNFEIQRQIAIDNLTSLMKVSPPLAQFISTTPEGLTMLLKNVDMRGIDALEEGLMQYIQQQQQQMQQQQQQQSQNSPAAIKMQEIQQRKEQSQMDYQIDIAKVNVDEMKADTDRMLAEQNIGIAMDKNEILRNKVQAENTRTAVDAATKLAGHHHTRAMDLLRHNHITQMKKPKEINNVS